MKKVQKIIAIILALIVMAGVYPVADFSGGKGVNAATEAEIVNDALSWAVMSDQWGNYSGKYYVNYKYGGLDLNSGVDCSGFVCAIYKRHGLDLVKSYSVRSTTDMYSKANQFGSIVSSVDAAKNGDIILTYSSKNGSATQPGHAGIIYISNGTKYIIHSNNTNGGVVCQPLSGYLGSAKVSMIIRPFVINGKQYSNATRTGGTPSSQTNDTTNTTSANNPGNPLAIPTATVTSSNRDAVKWIQTALNKVNGAGLTVDGALGPLTETAIKSFQTKYGLSATGIADVTTINKIVEVYKLSASISAVAINQQGVSVEEGKTVQLTATVTPASSQSVKLSWSTSNKNNATVSSTGLVTAVEGCETGNVTITVTTPNGKTASTVVKVIGKPRKNEWFKGKWYGGDGKQTYKPTGSWKLGSGGWWYGDTSGWWAYSQWQKIDDKWYYFNANGYIYTGWHQINGVWYYFKSTGEMAENEWCNGYWLSKGGAWSYQSIGKWKHNATGWWYEDTNGWYAKNETIKINGVKYTFNKDGYWDGKY